MNQLDLLRDTLLVSLVAILVFILYKRLLHMMGRQNVQAKYPALDAETTHQDGQVSIRLQLLQPMHLKVSVIDENRSVIQVIQDLYSEKGDHSFVFKTNGRHSGKYAFEIVTPHEKSLRYFQIS
jgi:hypothetical protein